LDRLKKKVVLDEKFAHRGCPRGAIEEGAGVFGEKTKGWRG